jgi:hypothetical protein
MNRAQVALMWAERPFNWTPKQAAGDFGCERPTVCGRVRVKMPSDCPRETNRAMVPCLQRTLWVRVAEQGWWVRAQFSLSSPLDPIASYTQHGGERHVRCHDRSPNPQPMASQHILPSPGTFRVVASHTEHMRAAQVRITATSNSGVDTSYARLKTALCYPRMG